VVKICNAFTLMLLREGALHSYMEVVEATPTILILLKRARIHVSERNGKEVGCLMLDVTTDFAGDINGNIAQDGVG